MFNTDLTAIAMLAFQAIFTFCLCYAIISDFTRLRIPNWIPIALAVLFLAYAAFRLDLITLRDHLAIAGIVFAAGFASFICGWVGGGDVKLIAAVSLWAGPRYGPDLLIWTTLSGGLMAFALLMLRNSMLARNLLPTAAPFRRIRSFAERGICPYGLAIGGAALLSLRPIFLPGN